MKQEKSKFELLRSKSIIAILDGDKDFGPLIINGVDSGIKISMPYLSGPMPCTISNNWGLPATYQAGLAKEYAVVELKEALRMMDLSRDSA